MYRVEDKYRCSERDMLLIQSRVKTVMRPDPAAGGVSYRITSLYFDDPDDTHWADSEDGVSYRNKYRIRIYNNSTDLIIGLYGNVAIAVFDGVVVVGHIAADGAILVVVFIVRLHASSYHSTVADSAVVEHFAADSADVTVVTIASTDVHIHQFEVHDFTVVYLAEECTVVVFAFDFQVSDDVSLSVEGSAKLVVVVPSDDMVVEVDIVHIEVVHQ